MSTRSWKALILEADPDFYERPVVYRFGGREFLEPSRAPVYIVTKDRKFIKTKDGKYIRIKD